MTDVPATAAEYVPSLWDLHKVLRPKDVRGELKPKTLRARAAVDLAIAEITSLHHASTHARAGVLDLDRALDTTLSPNLDPAPDDGRPS